MSASQIAAELEVSERTVLRDIDALSTTGFPVYAERGRNGGFRLLPGFTTDLTGLSVAEATALLSADASASLGMSAAFSSAMRKVAAGLSAEQRQVAANVADRVLVRPDGWLREAAPDAHIGTVQQAVFEGRALHIVYEGRTRPARARTVDPLGLVHAAGQWYLLASDDGKDRTFRVSRILEATITDEPAERSATIDLAALWDTRRDNFRSTREFVDARIRVRASALDRVAAIAVRVGDAAGVGDVAGDEWVEVAVVLCGADHAGSLAWALAGECEIIAPESLRSAVRDRACEMVLAHGSSGELAVSSE